MEQYISKTVIMAKIEEWRERIKKGILSIPLRGKDRASATFEYETLGKIKEFLDNLEVKEADFWHKQSEEDIDDSINDWSLHTYLCLMIDGSTQRFTGIRDESYDGSINIHLDCADDNYDWEYDNIIYWIEVPSIKAQKGENI